MLQTCIERMRCTIERPGDETQAELAAVRERELFLEVRFAAECPGVSAAENSQTACIRDRGRQTPARDQGHRRRENGMANSELLGQPRFHNPVLSRNPGEAPQTGMTFGPPEGRRSVG